MRRLDAIVKTTWKKRKKYKPQWTHYSFGGHVPMLERNAKGETTICGKTANRISATRCKNRVTCPRCIEKLKEDSWYCEEHGFLEGKDVTNDETCDYCGKSVA